MALLLLLKKSLVRISFCWIYGNQTGKKMLNYSWNEKKNQLGWGFIFVCVIKVCRICIFDLWHFGEVIKNSLHYICIIFVFAWLRWIDVRLASLYQYDSVSGFVLSISFGFYCDGLSFFTQTLWLPWVICGKIRSHSPYWLTPLWTLWNNLLAFDWSISSDVVTSPVTEFLHLALNSKTRFKKNAKMCRALIVRG